MNKNMKILDDFIFDLDVGYSVKDGFIFVFPSTSVYLLRKIKSKAKDLGIGYRTLKDGYVKFYFNEKLKKQNVNYEKKGFEIFKEVLQSFKEYKYIDTYFKRKRTFEVILNTFDVEDLKYMKKRLSQLAKKYSLNVKRIADDRLFITY